MAAIIGVHNICSVVPLTDGPHVYIITINSRPIKMLFIKCFPRIFIDNMLLTLFSSCCGPIIVVWFDEKLLQPLCDHDECIPVSPPNISSSQPCPCQASAKVTSLQGSLDHDKATLLLHWKATYRGYTIITLYKIRKKCAESINVPRTPNDPNTVRFLLLKYFRN